MALFRGKDLDLPELTQMYQLTVPEWGDDPLRLIDTELDIWAQLQTHTDSQLIAHEQPTGADALPKLSRGYERDPVVVREILEVRDLPSAVVMKLTEIIDSTKPGCLQLETLVYLVRMMARSGRTDDAWRITEALTRRVAPGITHRLTRIHGISSDRIEELFEEIIVRLYEAWFSNAPSDEFWEVRFGVCLDRTVIGAIRRHNLREFPEPDSKDKAIAWAMAHLKEPERSAFYWTAAAGLTNEQTAIHLGISSSKVRDYVIAAYASLEARSDRILTDDAYISLSPREHYDEAELLNLKALAIAHGINRRVLDSAVKEPGGAMWSVRDLQWIDAQHQDRLRIFGEDGLPSTVHDVNPNVRVPSTHVLNQFAPTPGHALLRRVVDGLWSVVTGHVRVGQCVECLNPFVANERGPVQVYCSSRCGTRVRVRRHAAHTNA